MWEWRIFGAPEQLPLPEREGEPVLREDVYLLGGTHDVGLKLRGTGKLELKLGGKTLHSISVEAATAEQCFALGQEAGFPLRGEAPPGVIVGGYPEALARFFP